MDPKGQVSAVGKLGSSMLLFIEAFDPEAPDWQAEAFRVGKQIGVERRDVRRFMNHPGVIRKLKFREEYGMDDVTANRLKRKMFWMSMMDDQIAEAKDRLRASELWGKSEGDFVHRVEANVNVAKDLDNKLTEALEKDDG